jgi:hypothetical protein
LWLKGVPRFGNGFFEAAPFGLPHLGIGYWVD